MRDVLHADLSFYDLLGVEPTASLAEIRAAYRANLGKYHPDVNSAPNATRLTALLNEAWETLRDPQRRAAYDSSFRTAQPNPRHESEPPPPPPPPPHPRPEPAASSPTAHSSIPDERTKAARLLVGWLGVIAGVICGFIGDRSGADYNGGYVFLFWVGVVGGGYLVRSASRVRRPAAVKVAWIAASAPICILAMALLAALNAQPQPSVGPVPVGATPTQNERQRDPEPVNAVGVPTPTPTVASAVIADTDTSQNSHASEPSKKRSEGSTSLDSVSAAEVQTTAVAATTDSEESKQASSGAAPSQERVDPPSSGVAPDSASSDPDAAASLIGRTEEEVLRRLGRPSLISNGILYYDNLDTSLRIYLSNGIVSDIRPRGGHLPAIRQAQPPSLPPQPPAGAVAQCGDGLFVFSQHVGGWCYGHGGVARRLDK